MNSIAGFVVLLFEPLAEDFADSHWRRKREEGGSGESRGGRVMRGEGGGEDDLHLLKVR
jgi:hypothetical protein